jgi:peptidoglycan LD-endopeptidase CwlK
MAPSLVLSKDISTNIFPSKTLQMHIAFFLCLFFLSLSSTFAEDSQNPAPTTATPQKRHESYTKYLSPEKLHDLALEALKSAYPSFDLRLLNGRLSFSTGISIVFDDGERMTAASLLEKPDVFDMFFYRYPSRQYRTGESGKAVNMPLTVDDWRLSLPTGIPYPEDPGRVRNDQFFRAMYGATEKEVRQKLVPVKWLPSAKGPSLLVTTVNGVDKALALVSEEFDRLPELWPYLLQPGGTFNWRVSAGTKRLSPHAFGVAVDINVGRSHYWHDIAREETTQVSYKNVIPAKIVEVFEKHGFIWGGWWYHFDTMHFEYRPELITYMNLVENEIAGLTKN